MPALRIAGAARMPCSLRHVLRHSRVCCDKPLPGLPVGTWTQSFPWRARARTATAWHPDAARAASALSVQRATKAVVVWGAREVTARRLLSPWRRLPPVQSAPLPSI